MAKELDVSHLGVEAIKPYTVNTRSSDAHHCNNVLHKCMRDQSH